jgi:drug/metabolite transporter (DMT)-like permease
VPLEWLALVAAASGACAHLAFKSAMGAGSPSALLMVRWSTGAVLLTALLPLAAGGLHLRPSTGIAFLVLGAVLGPVIGWSFYLRALPRLNVSVAQPIFNSAVLYTMLLAIVFLGERPTPFTVIGAALILLGVQMLQPPRSTPSARAGRVPGTDVLLVLAGAICLGASSFCFKLGLNELSPVETNWVRTTVPALVLVVGNLTAHWGRRKPAAVGPWLSRRGFALAVTAGVTNDVIGWLLRFTALKQGLVVVVEPLASTSPLFVALLSTWLLGERLGPRGWLGVAATVLGAVLLAAWGR